MNKFHPGHEYCSSPILTVIDQTNDKGETTAYGTNMNTYEYPLFLRD